MDKGDFTRAQYTAVVSDLHLCEEEPINLKFPLWKKYKTRQFFFDKQFEGFLRHIEGKAGGLPVELVLDGDIFDFDSVVSLPESPPYRVSWLEKNRGLHPQEIKSIYKIEKIFKDHDVWVAALGEFVRRGNKAIFVIGNHDLELHFPKVQKKIIEALQLNEEEKLLVRFVEWFYISNEDTLIEHGNQYDPYCVATDPVSPFVLKFNRIEVRIPFGNLATRYLINGMGFFNPHVDSNFIMSAKEYVVFFFRYIAKAQPFLMFTWMWGSVMVLLQSFLDSLLSPLREPLEIEGRIEDIAKRSNATPRMVRELRALTVAPATSHPWLIFKELWLDRALLVLIAMVLLFELFLVIDNIYSISFFWIFIPFSLFLPFFVFYSKSVFSEVQEYKVPKEKILVIASLITKVKRIIYGHTHVVRHERIGPVEHLNSGTWSPAFEDVECERPIDQKTYVWLYPVGREERSAKVLQYKDGMDYDVFSKKNTGRRKI